jgi:tripartite-type tricarboxylate transporter receptor subunit TctC
MKANPGALKYGSSGLGSTHHLAGELLRQKTGIEIVHIPYRGGGAAINDLIGGHINMAFLSLSAAVLHLAGGKIRFLAVVEKSRYAAMPNIPTVGETVTGFEMSSCLAILAPGGTPQPVIARLNAAIVQILQTEDVKERFATVCFRVTASSPGELAELVREGLATRGELIKSANILLD